MSVPHRTVPLAAVPESSEPKRCSECADKAKQLREARAQIRQLTEQNERLTRAIQRESVYMDERVMRNK